MLLETMKKKIFIIPFLFLSLLFTSCDFSSIFSIKVNSLTIEDTHGAYTIGEVYDEENELSITAKYTDGSKSKIKYNDPNLSFDLYTIENNVTNSYKTSSAFTIAKNYNLVVSYGNVKSNVLTIQVITSHVYVTSLHLSGDSEMDSWTTLSLILTVNPSNYSTKINFSASNPNLVTLTPTERGVDVFAQKSGEVDIIVSSKSSKITEISASHHITIKAVAQTIVMEQTYSDYVRNNLFTTSSTPLVGSPKLVVIPVWFTDSSRFITSDTHKQRVKNDIESAYFGDEESTGWYSVKTYYEEESEGRLSLTGKVSDWYNCGYSSTVAGKKDFDTSSLVISAVDWFFNKYPSEKRSDYDSNKDNVLDGVILIYAAPDHSNSGFGEYQNLWAYCFWIQKNLSGVYPNAFFWASYDFMYDKNSANYKAGTAYNYGDTSHTVIDTHTYIHEMGHMFGLDDYYDYSSQKYSPAGGFSMQDYNIGGHDPFSLLAFGWVDAYLPTESITLNIRSFTEGHDLIILSPGFNSYKSPFDEYLLIELYTPTITNELDTRYSYMSGYPRGSARSGIRLWHVDARLADSPQYKVYKLSDSADVVGRTRFQTAMKNTFNESDVDEDYLSVLGENYYDFNLLQLIRNNRSESYKTKSTFSDGDMFYKGDSFNIEKYSSQFVNGNKLNNNKNLGWVFTVNDITTDLLTGKTTASITLTRV